MPSAFGYKDLSGEYQPIVIRKLCDNVMFVSGAEQPVKEWKALWKKFYVPGLREFHLESNHTALRLVFAAPVPRAVGIEIQPFGLKTATANPDIIDFTDGWLITDTGRSPVRPAWKKLALQVFGGQTPMSNYLLNQAKNKWPAAPSSNLLVGPRQITIELFVSEELNALLPLWLRILPTQVIVKANPTTEIPVVDLTGQGPLIAPGWNHPFGTDQWNNPFVAQITGDPLAGLGTYTSSAPLDGAFESLMSVFSANTDG